MKKFHIMIDKCLYEKVSREAAFLFLFLVGCLSALATFEKPDFAFSETVEADAHVAFDNALKTEDWNRALKACIQLSIAESLISENNFHSGIEKFEKIADIAPSPWRNIAFLLEGKMYSQLYQSKRRIFDRRDVAASISNDNPMEWDGAMFRIKIEELLGRALQDSAEIYSRKIDVIKPLLSDSDDAIKYGISIGDFIGMQAVEMAENIGNETKDKYLSYIYDGSDEKTDLGRDAYLSWFRYTHSNSNRDSYLKNALKRFGDTKFATPFLLNKSFEGDTACYRVLTAYLNRFPDCVNVNAVKNRIASLLNKSVSFSCDGQYLSAQDFRLKVTSRNMPDFNVLILRLPDNQIGKELRLNKVAEVGKVVHSINCNNNALPAEFSERELNVRGLSQGVYAIVASRNEGLSGLIKGIYEKRSVPTFLISDISLFSVNDAKKNKYGRLYVVDARNQKPIYGAKVNLVSTDRNKKRTLSMVTDKEGKVDVPKSGWDVSVVYGKNRIQERVWGFEQLPGSGNSSKNAEILTDLSLYHPGDKIQFVVISYTEKNRELRSAGGEKMWLKLRDPDWKDVDSLELTTDNSGRAVGQFILPSSGKLGNYSVTASIGKLQLGSSSVMVTEYKAPQFYISANVEEKTSENVDSLNYKTIIIAGEVRNYSGVAEGNSLVHYSVEALPWRWGYVSGNAKITGECRTDNQGVFTIELKSSELPMITSGKGVMTATPYIVKLSASNKAGETAEGAPLRFFIGEGRSIQSSLPSRFEVTGKNKEFKVAVLDPLGNQTDGEIYYQIKNSKDEIVRSGSFTSPLFDCNFENLVSGGYKFIFSLNDCFSKESDEIVESDVIIYRPGDKIPPISTSLWVPDLKIEVDDNEKSVEIRYGSSFSSSWIFIQVADCDSILYSKWVENNGEMSSLKVHAPESNSRIYVTLSGMHDLKQESSTVVLVPSLQIEPIVVKTLSFRDKISPGSKEKWSFLFERNGKELVDMSVICVMSDKSLNAINPFIWNFNPQSRTYYPNLNQLSRYGYLNYNWYLQVSQSKNLPADPFSYPYFDQYGLTVYSGRNVYIRGRGLATNGIEQMSYASAKMMVASAKKEAASVETIAVADMVNEVADSGEEGGATESVHDNLLRLAEHPVAFFKPMLNTDRSGELSLEFEAPDFIGSWQFQMLGYSNDMKTAYWSKDIESSKQMMVKINYPRFLRTGDKAVITSAIYNNSDINTQVTVKIEIFDPITKAVIKTEEIKDRLIEKYASDVVSIEYQPFKTGSFGIRVVADDGKSSDGEQMLVPVFPSSDRVREGETYYFAPDHNFVELSVPERFIRQQGEDKKLTLSFCADPLWECVKALPEIKSDETFNSLKVTDNIFALLLEGKLFSENPRFAEVMKSAASTDKVSQLKDAVAQLAALQNSDGGWSWCKDMRSSEYVTRRVLRILGRLNQLGSLPDELKSLSVKGLSYLDRKAIENVNKFQGNKYPYLSLLDYLWVRELYTHKSENPMLSRIISNVVKALQNNWKTLSIADKSKASVVLNRYGYPMLAREILESLRQYATVTPGGGMWFDNIRDLGNTPLDISCMVLDSYSRISPDAKEVDQLRQWILLDKQTRNWGNGASAVNAIYSILNTGTKWIGDTTPEVRVSVDGKSVEISGQEKYTGSFTLSLPGDAKTLKIERSGSSPAWGGIVLDYIAPIKDIKAYSSNDLKVEKQIVGPSVLKVGDRVRVNLIITNNRAMDMVEVRDGLGAYLLPADQVSGYYGSDGIWMYKQVGKNSVNLFIENLLKGTHVFSYDCTVTHAGVYSEGIAVGECIVYPVITAHSAGKLRTVE